jgi:hypothetical protein
VFLLSRNPKHAGITNPLGSESLEERVGSIGGGNDLTAFEGHPLALEPT